MGFSISPDKKISEGTTEEVKIIWSRPYQFTESGILPGVMRTSSTLRLNKYDDASLLVEILDGVMRDFSERKL